ncbi:MAG: hypothetical protein HYV14_11725 [Elusimicrobia bacterium]|nr:hypothetical protein [Elusimicrobiota bacterium]
MKKTSKVLDAFNRIDKDLLPDIAAELLPKSTNHYVIHRNINCDADEVITVSHLLRLHPNEDIKQLWGNLIPRISAFLGKCGAKDFERIKHHKDEYIEIEAAYKGRGLRGIFSLLIYGLEGQECLLNLRLTESKRA